MKKIRGVALKKVLKAELKDKEVKMYFQQEKAKNQIATMVKQARQRACLTQEQLAQKADTSQVVIARLESALDTRIPSLSLLERIARALHAKLFLAFHYRPATSL